MASDAAPCEKELTLDEQKLVAEAGARFRAEAQAQAQEASRLPLDQCTTPAHILAALCHEAAPATTTNAAWWLSDLRSWKTRLNEAALRFHPDKIASADQQEQDAARGRFDAWHSVRRLVNKVNAITNLDTRTQLLEAHWNGTAAGVFLSPQQSREIHNLVTNLRRQLDECRRTADELKGAGQTANEHEPNETVPAVTAEKDSQQHAHCHNTRTVSRKRKQPDTRNDNLPDDDDGDEPVRQSKRARRTFLVGPKRSSSKRTRQTPSDDGDTKFVQIRRRADSAVVGVVKDFREAAQFVNAHPDRQPGKHYPSNVKKCLEGARQWYRGFGFSWTTECVSSSSSSSSAEDVDKGGGAAAN